jgi:hypothetical protein
MSFSMSRKMNLKGISTELARINAKIDNFTIMGTVAMANNEIETLRRDFTARLAILNEKMAEQKLSYENQLAETKAKIDESLSSLRSENEILRREMAEQKLFYENLRVEDRSRAQQPIAREVSAETKEAPTSSNGEKPKIEPKLKEPKLTHQNQPMKIYFRH